MEVAAAFSPDTDRKKNALFVRSDGGGVVNHRIVSHFIGGFQLYAADWTKRRVRANFKTKQQRHNHHNHHQQQQHLGGSRRNGASGGGGGGATYDQLLADRRT